jgi:hypothetical protein
MKTMSQRAYAKHRRCALSTVQEAIKSGRLAKSARRVKGQWQIDPALADKEWAASTHSDRAPLTGPTAPRASPPATEEEGDFNPLAEARARHEMAKAELAEIELAERRGDLVVAKEVESRLAGVFANCKRKLLGVPPRARQQDPTLTEAQLGLVDSLIRETLEDLASGDVADRAA